MPQARTCTCIMLISQTTLPMAATAARRCAPKAPHWTWYTFSNNQSGAHGGALAITGTLAMSRTLFINNSAAAGGGLYQSTGPGRIVNSLFTRNAASSTNGMDLYLAPSGSLQILFSTFAAPNPYAR